MILDLKLGISEKSIFHEFHPDAEDLFNVTCDLKLVCEKLRDRSQRHKRQVCALDIWIMSPFQLRWQTIGCDDVLYVLLCHLQFPESAFLFFILECWERF